MGCIFARPVPVTGAQRAERPAARMSRVTVSGDRCLVDFQQVTSEFRSIAKIAGTNPVVCLSDSSFPIIVSRLFLEDDRQTSVSLPVVAGARFGQGKILAFGNIAIMLEENRATADTDNFLASACQWTSETKSAASAVLLFDLPEVFAKETRAFLQQFKLEADASSSLENLERYKIVAVASTSRVDDSLVEFVREGGSLVCFFNPYATGEENAFEVNSVLIQMGIGYTFCCFSVGDSKSFRVEVPRRYQDISHLTFKGACERYIEYLQKPNVRESELDDLVTALKFYLIVWNDNESEKLVPIAEATWDFLQRTNYKSARGICPEMVQVIAVILAGQLLYKLPKPYVAGLAEKLGCNEFPGGNGPVELAVHKVGIDIDSFAWFSTGLWLPANVVAKVRCDVEMPYLHVQVGAHHESLLSKPGPYKRWPVAVMSYPLTDTEIEVVSPFGGIVYIVGAQLPETAPPHIDIEFENFCQYPQAVKGEPEVWARTKNLNVPWCELVAPTFILTVPTTFVHEYEQSLESFFEIFEKLVAETISFTSCVLFRPYRIVFDIDLAGDGVSYGYPLVLPLDDLPFVLVKKQPTKQLFELLLVMASISIREGCFDASTEAALVTVSACSAIKEVWPDCNPLIFLEGEAMPLFGNLWDLHRNFNKNLIPMTLAIFQSAEYKVMSTPDDMWIEFICQLCRIGGQNFTPLLQHARPIPLNISLSLQSLPEFTKIPPPE